MPNQLATGMAWLTEQRHAHMTSSVTYTRGVLSVSPDATIGETIWEADGQYEVSDRTTSTDFLIRVVDLVLGGVTVLPVAGDQITSGGATFEVMSPASEPEWRYSDPQNRDTLRVHTKEVG